MTIADAFPCTSCGACCRRVGSVTGHDLPVRRDGSCGYLEGRRCSIYENRPDICRVDVMIERMAESGSASKLELQNITARLCNRFQKDDGMDAEKYNVREI